MSSDSARNTFKKNLSTQHSLRLHMTVMLMLAGLLAFIINVLLYKFVPEISMPARYSLVVLSGYMFLLLSIKFWIHYIFPGLPFFDGEDFEVPDLVIFNPPQSRITFDGEGGKFSGGGASGSWAEGATEAEVNQGLSNNSIPAKDLSLSDLDSDSFPLIAVAATAAVVLSVAAVVLSIVYFAPVILGEIAFEVVLSIGFYKSFKKTLNSHNSRPDWQWMAFKKTIPFFLILLVINLCLCLWLSSHYPHIRKFSDVFIMDYQK
ncbi:MAG: hypothetical protein EOP04_20555 [Proteobacteria bacterium]|nr:MAG: hypothetical protein EOP04_20555 [Pseudomonadota bacterium]